MARNQPDGRRTRTTQAARPWNQRNESSGGGWTSGLLSLAGGVGVGAALMYLFDPEAGAQRRQQSAERAKSAMESGGSVLGSALHSGKDALGGAWETVSEKAVGVAESLRESMPRLQGRQLLERATDNACETAGSWLHSARDYLPSVGQRRSGYSKTTASAAALSMLALGVGAMWFLDPNRGRARRAWVGQKTTRLLNETGDFMNATGRHLRNKARGYYYQTTGAFRHAGEYLGDSAIAERVRAALGRIGVSGSSIGVRCADGQIHLTGRCAANDVSRILGIVRNVAGVRGIDNEVDIGTTFGTSSTPNMSNLSA